jgi:anti-sigma B factor antagonist
MQVTATFGPVTLLSVQGNVDSSTFRELVEKAEQVIKQGYPKLVLDLHEVNYVSSAGLMALQTIAGAANDNGGKMVVSGLNKQVQHVMELAGFDKILSIFSDAAAAQASFENS